MKDKLDTNPSWMISTAETKHYERLSFLQNKANL